MSNPYRMYIKLYGRPVEFDERSIMESKLLRDYYEGECYDVISFKIKSSSFEKALDFCKKRAKIMIRCNKDDDEKLQNELKDFGADFLKQIESDGVDIIHLIEAACKLEINSLLDLLLEPVVKIITHKTPQEIEKMFVIRYNGNERMLNQMIKALGYAKWVLKEMSTTKNTNDDNNKAAATEEEKKKKFDLLKMSPARFKTLSYEERRYWVYAHFVFQKNQIMFKGRNLLSDDEVAALQEEEKEREEEELKEQQEKESKAESFKVPKNDDGGGFGPRGVYWTRSHKAAIAAV